MAVCGPGQIHIKFPNDVVQGLQAAMQSFVTDQLTSVEVGLFVLSLFPSGHGVRAGDYTAIQFAFGEMGLEVDICPHMLASLPEPPNEAAISAFANKLGDFLGGLGVEQAALFLASIRPAIHFDQGQAPLTVSLGDGDELIIDPEYVGHVKWPPGKL